MSSIDFDVRIFPIVASGIETDNKNDKLISRFLIVCHNSSSAHGGGGASKVSLVSRDILERGLDEYLCDSSSRRESSSSWDDPLVACFHTGSPTVTLDTVGNGGPRASSFLLRTTTVSEEEKHDPSFFCDIVQRDVFGCSSRLVDNSDLSTSLASSYLSGEPDLLYLVVKVDIYVFC
ncbi:hypothetical protein [Candidatus Ichthyocystis hellenicum]|uniref:hypothetical protein n=1 Tax=Candidatus Ichthyocystis hellenicum TaxID=1561003 RepID=UPI0011129104|nr:hypothetical protein [Candidatus Ichthyocystis hellenicum]